MIGVHINGRLGNQLFQYAFIYNQHKIFKTPFFLSKTGAPLEIYKYFKLERNLFYFIDRAFFNHGNFKLVFSHYLRNSFYGVIRNKTIENEVILDNAIEPESQLSAFRNKTLYTGFFQSEVYFKEFVTEIPKIFQIKNRFKKEFQDKFGATFNNFHTVAIHVRKTDYLDLEHLGLGGADLSLPFNYYTNLLKEIYNPKNFYFIISDDIDIAKNEFPNLVNVYFSHESEIVDFQIMKNADTCIISNSTFSWWAAYLNTSSNQKVYCPKYFLGHLKKKEYPSGIYPKHWIQVDVPPKITPSLK